MKTATLKEIVPEQAWPAIERLVQNGHRRAEDFLPTLEQWRDEMLRRGVLPEYAAYALEYAIDSLAAYTNEHSTCSICKCPRIKTDGGCLWYRYKQPCRPRD